MWGQCNTTLNHTKQGRHRRGLARYRDRHEASAITHPHSYFRSCSMSKGRPFTAERSRTWLTSSLKGRSDRRGLFLRSNLEGDLGNNERKLRIQSNNGELCRLLYIAGPIDGHTDKSSTREEVKFLCYARNVCSKLSVIMVPVPTISCLSLRCRPFNASLIAT